MDLAPASGLRIVAVNRRGYPGSTPLSPADVETINSKENDDEKRGLLRTLCIQLAAFIDGFSERNGLPPLSADGTTGGFAVVGWSMGCAFALGVAACVETLPAAIQRRFGANLRAIILEGIHPRSSSSFHALSTPTEAADGALGMDMHPKAYTPLLDTNILDEQRVARWMTWMTSYFQHGDLSQRDPDPVEYVVPWDGRVPTLDNMSEAQVEKMVHQDCAWTSELPMLVNMQSQLRESYEKACFGQDVRRLLPRMKIWVITGDHTASFSLNAHFKMEADNARSGGGHLKFRIVPGGNHFVSQL